MFDEHDILALLEAYIDGDTLARKVLVDALDEAGDERAEQFREEGIDWDALALRLSGEKKKSHWYSLSGESAKMRFRIDCVRFGSSTTPEVTEAVQNARRAYARKLFPTLEL